MTFRLEIEKLKKYLKSCLIAFLVGGLIVVQIAGFTPFDSLRNAYFDFAQRLLDPPAQSAPIVIVDIDEESIAAFGQWPWSRDQIAEIVSQLAVGNPAVIGIVLIFPEPDRLSPENALSGLEVTPLMREQLAALPTNDQALANSLKKVPTVLATAAMRHLPESAGRLAVRTPIELKLGWSSTPRLTRYPAMLSSLPVIDAAGAGSGITSVELDRDGVIRRLPAIAIVDDAIVPSFALEVLRVYRGARAIGVENADTGIRKLSVGSTDLATDDGGNIWIRHVPSERIPRFSAAEVLFGRVEAGDVADKIVLIGATGVGLDRSFVSASGSTMSALDAQAMFVENIVSEIYLQRSDMFVLIEVLATLIGCLGVVLLHGHLRSYFGQTAIFAYAVFLFGMGLYLFQAQRMLFDASFSLVAILIFYLLFIGLEIVATQRERRQTEIARRTALMLAESASQSKTNFLAGMSHELRTPLNAILGFSEMIKDGVLGPVSPPNYANYAKDIHDSASHLLALVTQILDMANLEAGETRLNVSKFSLSEVLDESLRTIRTKATDSAPTIAMPDSSTLPLLRADRRMVTQMILNLLLNAVKFSPPDGPIVISAHFERNGDFSLSVTDAGSGMSPKQVAEAFEIFQDAVQTVSDSARGIGLGLPITTAMIEEHGGSLNVDSEKGRGTRMTLTFPRNRVDRNE